MYIILAQQYYEWIAARCREFWQQNPTKKYLPAELEQESSASADPTWMGQEFTIISIQGEVATVKGNKDNKKRKVPISSLVKLP